MIMDATGDDPSRVPGGEETDIEGDDDVTGEETAGETEAATATVGATTPDVDDDDGDDTAEDTGSTGDTGDDNQVTEVTTPLPVSTTTTIATPTVTITPSPQPVQQQSSGVQPSTVSTPVPPLGQFSDVARLLTPSTTLATPWNPSPTALPFPITPSLLQWLSLYPGDLTRAMPATIPSPQVQPATPPQTDIPSTPTPPAVPRDTSMTTPTPPSSLPTVRRSPSDTGSSRSKKKSKKTRFSLKKPAPK